MIDFKPYQNLAKSILVTALRDYYNMINGKGARASKSEGYSVKKWINSENFSFWCYVADYNPELWREMFKSLLKKIDEGESVKGFEKKIKAL